MFSSLQHTFGHSTATNALNRRWLVLIKRRLETFIILQTSPHKKGSVDQIGRKLFSEIFLAIYCQAQSQLQLCWTEISFIFGFKVPFLKLIQLKFSLSVLVQVGVVGETKNKASTSSAELKLGLSLAKVRKYICFQKESLIFL